MLTPISKCNITGCKHGRYKQECIPPPESTTQVLSNGCNPGFKAISTSEEKKVLLEKVYHPLRATSPPFGTAAGFPTNLGVVAMPSDPVGGYIYTEDQGWILYATPR